MYTTRTLPGSRGIVTRALVGVNALVFVFAITSLGSTVASAGLAAFDYGTWGRAIDLGGEWWRIFTGGFLHSGIIHIAFNMYLLWQLGQRLEREMGEGQFLLAYIVSLIGGSFGAMLLQPDVPVVGASGAVFGLIGVMVLFLRSRGIGLFDTGLGMLILINAFLSFRSGVSLGGHAGGFLVGLVIGAMYFGVNPGDGPLFGKNPRIPLAATAVLGVLLFVGSLWAASNWLTPLI